MRSKHFSEAILGHWGMQSRFSIASLSEGKIGMGQNIHIHQLLVLTRILGQNLGELGFIICIICMYIYIYMYITRISNMCLYIYIYTYSIYNMHIYIYIQ